MIAGWDIGGVNLKAAVVRDGQLLAVREEAFELQRAPATLVARLRDLAGAVGAAGAARHAVTMTAELSQMFRTKREGVAFVLDAMRQAFPATPIEVYSVDGRFVDPSEACAHPLSVAAANWMATASIVAQQHTNAVLVDVGSTTADVIAIVDGAVAATGRSDLDRLASGELVYTGAVRTPVEAVASSVRLGEGYVGVAAENFALMGDVHVWLGTLAPSDYSAPAPDGRPLTREFVKERLARAVCADREMLGDDDVTAIATSWAAAQVGQLARAIRGVLSRTPPLREAVVAGRGAFIGAAAARAAGLNVVPLSASLGADGSRSAPAAAVALLLDAGSREGRFPSDRRRPERFRVGSGASVAVDVVVKVGGGLLQEPSDLAPVLQAIDEARVPLLVVPGGGPFADAVRLMDGPLGLSPTEAHWMAVRAMDVYAELLASRLRRGRLVEDGGQLRTAVDAGCTPVLAPSRWLRLSDPVPHSWEVTSDSIAAWVAATVGAAALLLVKPRGAQGDMTDPFFTRVRAAKLEVAVLTAADTGELARLLGATSPAAAS